MKFSINTLFITEQKSNLIFYFNICVFLCVKFEAGEVLGILSLA